MNILLTNDDGISSPGIVKLAEKLREGNDRIVVLAPDSNRSGVSHSLINIYKPLLLSPRDPGNWDCSGTPADCVILAVKGAIAGFYPDLVLSGINAGPNLGTDIIYSGTAAAARQAALMGIPGIAFSLSAKEAFDWDPAVSWIGEHLSELKNLWTQDTFINVNIPNCPPAGEALTWPTVKDYRDTLDVEAGPEGALHCTVRMGMGKALEEPGSDCDAVSRNLVSISPVFIHPPVLGERCPGAPAFASVRCARPGRG